MHAIWFSILVPALFASVWIWPELRVPKVWLGVLLIALTVAVVWSVIDLGNHKELSSTPANLWLRPLYLFLSETGKPILQLVLGLLVATIYSSCSKHAET